ncbi:Putative membrane protein, MmpS family [Mycobacteroides abscessus subsp. abscessus]|nr:Putative membrane protein, MmpS family [Mycobacteroides abscessus subsp. abscessus]
MSRRSVVRPILARAWMPLVSIVAVSVGAVASKSDSPTRFSAPAVGQCFPTWTSTGTRTRLTAPICLLTVVSGSISVQVRGGEVGCRILVNDVVRDEKFDDHHDADVTCRVKSV